MCGVFGFVSSGGKGPNMDKLAEIAASNQIRGRDAFGFAWIDKQGKLRTFKQAGPIADNLGMLMMAKDARLLIGHTRYATHGSPANNCNNHPHKAGSGWLVHNGVLLDHLRVARRLKVTPKTECDSEVLGLAFERMGGPLFQRLRMMLRQFDPAPCVVLGLWSNRTDGGRLCFFRRGNQPLSAGRCKEGAYLSSVPFALPRNASMLPSDYGFLVNQTEVIEHGAI